MKVVKTWYFLTKLKTLVHCSKINITHEEDPPTCSANFESSRLKRVIFLRKMKSEVRFSSFKLPSSKSRGSLGYIDLIVYLSKQNSIALATLDMI